MLYFFGLPVPHYFLLGIPQYEFFIFLPLPLQDGRTEIPRVDVHPFGEDLDFYNFLVLLDDLFQSASHPLRVGLVFFFFSFFVDSSKIFLFCKRCVRA